MRRLAPAAVLSSLLLLSTACGGAGTLPTGTGKLNAANGANTFSTCMRSHGIPGFPDLGNNYRFKITPESVQINGEKISVNSTVVHSALSSCRHYLHSGGAGEGPTAAQRRAAREWASCMRAHGLPDFPDPKVAGGMLQMQLNGLNPDSAPFRAAQTTCQHFLASTFGLPPSRARS